MSFRNNKIILLIVLSLEFSFYGNNILARELRDKEQDR